MDCITPQHPIPSIPTLTLNNNKEGSLLPVTTPSSPSPPPSVTASDPRAAPSPPSCSSQLLNFKRGIKRDVSAYPALKDEKYYESFKRSVLVTARAHDCEEILQTTYRPTSDADSLELFRLKNDFMYSVFNKGHSPRGPKSKF